MKDTRDSTKTATKKRYEGFTEAEKSAMKDRVKEMKAGEDGESQVRAAISEMHESDRALAKRIDALVKESAPGLTSKTWYGMPAYAKDGKTICFFKPSHKFKARYSTIGFNDAAKLDDGSMWPTEYALTKLTAADEVRIAALIKKAAS
jgi:uncharacterized protein YdhG (YjbR/CyaY superfamily)